MESQTFIINESSDKESKDDLALYEVKRIDKEFFESIVIHPGPDKKRTRFVLLPFNNNPYHIYVCHDKKFNPERSLYIIKYYQYNCHYQFGSLAFNEGDSIGVFVKKLYLLI